MSLFNISVYSLSFFLLCFTQSLNFQLSVIASLFLSTYLFFLFVTFYTIIYVVPQSVYYPVAYTLSLTIMSITYLSPQLAACHVISWIYVLVCLLVCSFLDM
jgi:hypothetical protein